MSGGKIGALGTVDILVNEPLQVVDNIVAWYRNVEDKSFAFDETVKSIGVSRNDLRCLWH